MHPQLSNLECYPVSSASFKASHYKYITKLAIRMAVATSLLPTTFQQCQRDPAMPFETWLKMLQNYLLMIDMEGVKWPDTPKQAVLLHNVGTEVELKRIFITLTETGTTYKHTVTAHSTFGAEGKCHH